MYQLHCGGLYHNYLNYLSLMHIRDIIIATVPIASYTHMQLPLYVHNLRILENSPKASEKEGDTGKSK